MPALLLGLWLNITHQVEAESKQLIPLMQADDSAEGRLPTGPAVGEPVPDFTLPDQHGKPIHFSEVRGKNQALILFYRSASW